MAFEKSAFIAMVAAMRADGLCAAEEHCGAVARGACWGPSCMLFGGRSAGKRILKWGLDAEGWFSPAPHGLAGLARKACF
uniref:Putative secreted protein n=1 Tax=Ixodes ricinus TaxID=34613 RepID=A0A6B0TVV4_IXORI